MSGSRSVAEPSPDAPGSILPGPIVPVVNKPPWCSPGFLGRADTQFVPVLPRLEPPTTR
jgi:hypothetical protein